MSRDAYQTLVYAIEEFDVPIIVVTNECMYCLRDDLDLQVGVQPVPERDRELIPFESIGFLVCADCADNNIIKVIDYPTFLGFVIDAAQRQLIIMRKEGSEIRVYEAFEDIKL